MRITEAQLRTVIRNILLNEATQASNASSHFDVQVPGDLYGFGNALLGNLQAGRPSPLIDTLLGLFGVSRKDNKPVEPLLHGAAVTFIMEYRDSAWDVATRIKPIQGMEPLEPLALGTKLVSAGGAEWKRNDRLYTGAEPPDTLIESIEEQIGAQLDKIPYSTFSSALKPDGSQQFCLSCKVGEISLDVCVPVPRVA